LTNMGKVYLIGAGIGSADMITVRGLRLLKEADVIVYDRLMNEELLKENPTAKLIFAGKVAGDHAIPQGDLSELLAALAKEGHIVARLKGGDPYIFGRGGEEAQVLYQHGVPFEVVPGVTTASAGLMAAGIPATHRDHASSLHLITGHRKGEAELDFATLAKLTGTLVFYMGLGNLENLSRQLLHHGMAADTPAAVVSRAGGPMQKTVTGTLADIYDKAKDLPAPAVIVLGGVVTLRAELNFFEQRPLFGRTCVVTRARQQASALSNRLKNLGARVIEAPAIRIEEENIDLLAEKLQDLKSYTHLLFTSANSVHILMRELKKIGDLRLLAGITIGAVGEGTGGVLETYGIRADIIPERFVAESFMQKLLPTLNESSRVLLPRSRSARAVLKEDLNKICTVDELFIYDSKPEPLSPETYEALLAEKVDVLTFMSAKTVEYFTASLDEKLRAHLDTARVYAIGPITARKVKSSGWHLHKEAPVFTTDALIETILTDWEEN